MARETFVISGVREIQQALKALPATLARKVIRQEVRKGIKVLADDVRARAPVYKGPRKDVPKGALKRDIRVRARAKRKRGVIAIDVVSGKGTAKTKGAYYAGMVEYGTSKMASHPYIRPAFDANKGRIGSMVKAGIRAGVEREVRAGRGK